MHFNFTFYKSNVAAFWGSGEPLEPVLGRIGIRIGSSKLGIAGSLLLQSPPVRVHPHFPLAPLSIAPPLGLRCRPSLLLGED